MKTKYFAALCIAGACLTNPAAASEDGPSSTSSASTYRATVDPAAFRPVVLEHKKLGVTTTPTTIRLITPGVDKFSIYPLIGAPHFAEGITRRWNYVLFFPAAPGSTERVRCRMEIRFERPRGHYSVVVSEVVWQEQSCADRVAAAS